MNRTTGRHNTQLFALPQPPPERVELGGVRYRLVRVFKHDFFAATCLYEAAADDLRARNPDAIARIVVKFGRTQVFCGLPTAWYAAFMRAHEEGIYRALAGIPGVPRWAGRVGENGYAIEYVDARPLDHLAGPPPGFFDRIREVLDAIHARGVAYGDANKRSNILVGPGGEPFLVDYQIAIRRRDDLPWPIGAIVAAVVAYVQRSDLYHLYKHKRRLAPSELRPQEEALSRRRGLLHTIHRKLTDPWRFLRRRFLRGQHRTGRLASPTAALEDHHQPEKATWRVD